MNILNGYSHIPIYPDNKSSVIIWISVSIPDNCQGPCMHCWTS